MTMDLSTVPLIAISTGSKQVISTLLNPIKVLPSENGLPRDWRGLAYLLEFSVEVMSLLSSHSNPTIHMFIILEQKQKRFATIKDFQRMMEQINRWDIIDDTEDMFEKDAIRYLEEKQRAQVSADAMEENVDKEILTQGDVHRLREGLEAQYYDAFLLYADEDISFANEMVEKLETEYQLKLCLKDRDLVAGITFEHEAVMKIIKERCNRVLIIISPNFLVSSANKFFLNYTQALSIDTRQRKIVPCLYERCELPMQLKYMFLLDYNRRGLYDFWGRLRDSIQALNSSVTCTQKITEVTNTLPDKCSNISQAAKQETSKNRQQKIENCVNENINDTKALNSGTKKNKMLLKWIKGAANRKTKQTEQNNALIMDKLQNLPSLDNLDSLDLTSNSTTNVYKKKKKKNLFDKFTKKGQMRKIAMQV